MQFLDVLSRLKQDVGESLDDLHWSVLAGTSCSPPVLYIDNMLLLLINNKTSKKTERIFPLIHSLTKSSRRNRKYANAIF